MEPCSGRQPRCLKKLTKIALAHFAWPFIVATTMIPQQSITKNHCLGSTRRFHVCIDIDPNKVFSNSSTLVNVSGISWPLSALSTNISSLARRNNLKINKPLDGKAARGDNQEGPERTWQNQANHQEDVFCFEIIFAVFIYIYIYIYIYYFFFSLFVFLGFVTLGGVAMDLGIPKSRKQHSETYFSHVRILF